MALKNFFGLERCNKCKENFPQRSCVKYGKKLCWKCCNSIRIKMKCPETCKYHIVEKNDSIITFNSDSQTEYEDIIRKWIVIFLRKSNSNINNKSPIELKYLGENRKLLLDFIDNLQNLNDFSKSIIYQELGLLAKENIEIFNPEKVAELFIYNLINFKWNECIELLKNSEQYKLEQYKKNFIKRISENKVIKKMSSFSIVHSGMNKERNSMIVQFYVNKKFNLSCVLVKENEKKWLVKDFFMESVQFYDTLNEINGTIATLISRNELVLALNQIEKALAIFPNSSDIYYYLGIVNALTNKIEKAKEAYFTAIEIEPDFIEAMYDYATILYSLKDIKQTKYFYNKILDKSPHLNSMNNLATIYESEGDIEKAVNLYKKCLEIDNNFEPALKNIERINNKG